MSDFLYKRESAWLHTNKDEVFLFAKGYKSFLSKAKTERLATKEIIAVLKKKGFKDINDQKKLKAYDKVYKVFKNRVVLAAIVGKDTNKIRLIGSHIDSPRLDIKPLPMYEKSALAMLKTHYYGGIKKYQWFNIPLSVHVVVHTKDGKQEFSFGEGDEPKLIIPDLLIHLSRDQMQKKMDESLTAEHLNVILGNIPTDDKDIKDPVKFEVLRFLNDKHGITERDIQSADITLTPAMDPVDTGFDASLITAYGHDDKSCVYSSLQAFLETPKPKCTSIVYFTDKEEIGSYGDTGAQGSVLKYFLEDLYELLGKHNQLRKIIEQSASISADVTGGMNPNFAELHDQQNTSLMGCGVAMEKYGGARGKAVTNDASSEYMSWLARIFEQNNVIWQTGEVGKLDMGGGGTIGMFIAHLGFDCIDIGPPVLSMHNPYEILSKVDLFHTYKAYKAFLEN